jgi:hypothetical protein
MAFTHPHINAYVIVGGDSDFLSLVEKLKQYDKKVFVVGGRAFTSVILQRNCHEFIAYENLMRKPAARGGRPAVAGGSAPIAQAFAIVRRALKILADREVTPQTGLLKSTLLQLDSTFSERNYGASSFLDFVEKLAKEGLVQLKHSGRSTTVELTGGPTEETEPVAEDSEAARSMPPPAPLQGAAPIEPVGDNAEGVRIAGQIMAAATNARWPMYLRNVKQILRAGGFDERRYRFGGLIELLRACQKEGLIRMERDRRGGLRVFQGPQTSRPSVPAPIHEPVSEPLAEAVEVEVVPDTAIFTPIDASYDVEEEPQPAVVVDTTAELLGRAKSKRPARTSRPTASTPRKAAAKKSGTATQSRRPARAKKAAGEAREG